MKREAFFDKVVVNELFSVGNKLEPVYITPSERENAESVSNQTREKILSKIEELISQIEVEELRIYFIDVFQCSKGRRKEVLVNLHKDIMADLQDVTVELVETDQSSGNNVTFI